MHDRANHASSKFKDWQFIREVHRKLVREWFRDFSALERLALLFIYDRTLGWGKEWERITMDQCSQGVISDEGVCYAAPFTSCRKRAAATLTALFDAGAIRRGPASADKSRRYALNFDYKPNMQLPKRLKHGGGTAPYVGAETPHTLGAETPHQREEEIRVTKEKSLVAASDHQSAGATDSRDELEIAITKVRSRSKSRASEKSKAGRALRKDGSGILPTKTALAAMWRSLWMEHFPDLALDAPPQISLHILWQYSKKWTEARKAGEFADYLAWLFENWNAVRLGSFSWMAGAPKAPALRLIVSAKLRAYFEEAYRDKETVALWRKLEPHERRLNELVESGMDPDKARESVEKEFASKKELVELHKARQRMSAMLETFNRRQGHHAASSAEERPTKPRALRPTESFNKWKEE